MPRQCCLTSAVDYFGYVLASFNALEAMGAVFQAWITARWLRRLAMPGEVLIAEGSDEARLWLIETGNASVSTTGPDGQAIPLADLADGALIGEMSVLEGHSAATSGVAAYNCRVIGIDTAALEASMAQDPRLASDVNSLFARKLARQLASHNSFIHRWRNTPV